MPKLTIGRMAKLYGLHRSTLYEAVAKGRISCGFDGQGRRVIDLSEMVRVYGEAPHSGQPGPTPPDSVQTAPDNSELLARFDELLRLTERQSEQLEALRREVAELRALPAPQPAQEPPPAPGRAPGEVRSLEDVLARFEARRH